MNETAAPAKQRDSSPCPGPIPKSLDHAERCRACGKCGVILWPLADGAGEDAWTGGKAGRIN